MTEASINQMLLPPTQILVAPDKFKGSLTAASLRDEIAAGLRSAPGRWEINGVPVADGGEGTAAALLDARGGTWVRCAALDPLGRRVDAGFALLDSGATAVVEVASASGLALVDEGQRDAEAASSLGTGELIAAAVAAGARTILVAAGGSASSDGGRGALEALGASFGAGGPKVDTLAATLTGIRVVVLCDVDVPLVGPSGSARAFAPQKGADDAAVDRLERRLQDWGELAAASTGRDPRTRAMAGAAGGLAAGLWAFAGAELRAGAAYVLDSGGFDQHLAGVDAVITGEGRIDSQTLRGKIVGEIARRTRRARIPCFALVGADALPAGTRPGLEVRVVAPGRIATGPDVRAAAAALGRELRS
jgi:glycerate kinase